MTALTQSHRPIRSFVRRGSRTLSPRQKLLLAQYLPRLALPEEGRIDLDSLFAGAPVTLEIGFGGGEHLIAQAARAPAHGFIGAEPFTEGVAKLVTAIDESGIANIRVWADDVRNLIDRLPAQSIARVFILFPDPWPKRRQQKRRLIQPDFLTALHGVCRPGASVRFATDVASYADEALVCFLNHGGFVFSPERADDWREAPGNHVTTRYEEKRLGDCSPVWFDFAVTNPSHAAHDAGKA
jgi:tRNA (guanine-N7-)-methyltransferase